MKQRKWSIFIVFVIILAIIFFWGSRPQRGKIEVKKADKTAVLSRTEQKYENDYLSFNYSDDYEKTIENNNLWLVGRSRISESFTLICREFEGILDDDSGVKMRQIKTEEYDEKNINIDGAPGLLFSKKDQSERTIFIKNNGILISFSMKAFSNDEKPGEKFLKIIESWEWKYPSPTATDW